MYREPREYLPQQVNRDPALVTASACCLLVWTTIRRPPIDPSQLTDCSMLETQVFALVVKVACQRTACALSLLLKVSFNLFFLLLVYWFSVCSC